MTGHSNSLLLTTGLAAFVLLGMAQSIFGLLLPVLALRFDLAIATVGWLLSLFWAGCLGGVGAVYARPGGPGPRLGLGLSALGCALIATQAGWPVVLLGGLLFGAGYGILAAVYNPRVLAAFGPLGPSMMSLLNAVFTVGAIAAPLVFLALDSDPVRTFAVFAGFALLVLVAALPLRPPEAAKTADQARISPDWLALGFAVLGIGIESTLIGLGPTGLVQSGLEPGTAGILLSRFFVAYLLARVLLIFLAPRVQPFLIYLLAWALTLVFALASMAGAPAFWFPVIGFAAGLFFHGGFLTGLARMGATNRVSALLLAAGLVGAIIQPLIISQLLEGLGPLGFFQIVAAIALVMTLVSALALRRMSRPA